ncbi:hypothetical protein [Nocardioides pelophilus]|uniref:hypothetical protein n=1 Tax=Nocardioides pelophilus TaxID=2172019 RepID=UPI001600BEA8|nr:hypothetical protein [Nocardioides pelophilus]
MSEFRGSGRAVHWDAWQRTQPRSLEAGRALDLDDRAAAARALPASLPGSAEDQTAIYGAWATEIARHVDDVLADRGELIDADEALRTAPKRTGRSARVSLPQREHPEAGAEFDAAVRW